MAYSAEISRNSPGCFLFLIDRSGSMADPFGNPEVQRSKAQGVSDAINRLLQNLVIKCAKSEGVRDYYEVGVIGYGNTVTPALGGELAGKELVPISELANRPARIEERSRKVDDGAGGLVEQKVKFPIWLDPVADGGTPMTEAFREANRIIAQWLGRHPDSFPPVVIHITDGESTDGDPSAEMRKLTSQASTDGNVLLFNLHLSGKNIPPISFPDNEELLPDEFARMLFETASPMTDFMRNVAKEEYGHELSEESRCFVLNGDLVLVITALEIGTRPSNLR
jgi:hypothetical protein